MGAGEVIDDDDELLYAHDNQVMEAYHESKPQHDRSISTVRPAKDKTGNILVLHADSDPDSNSAWNISNIKSVN